MSPILDIQQRFRELGRIRTGKTEPTGRRNKRGEEIMRPVKLATFRITSPWKHLIEAAADAFGGEPQPWDNEGTQEWQVFTTSADEAGIALLPVLVPPGEILDQWYELWSGGGCVKRCDGIRQTLKDAGCTCPKDPAERQEKASKGEACKPTTRLRVMLPQIPDLGTWRIESHGFYAATELGQAAGLVELATRRGAIIPADLRLVAREGARRPGEVRKKFFVPALSFRGTLGDTLDALGMLEAGQDLPAMLSGVERRPALDSGGRPELPPASTGDFRAGTPMEEAAIPPPRPEAPARESRPPDDDHISPLARAQAIAMRARDAGVDRGRLISAVTKGRVTSAKEVTDEEAERVFEALHKISRGELVLVNGNQGWRLYGPEGARAYAATIEEEPAPPRAGERMGEESSSPPAETTPEEGGYPPVPPPPAAPPTVIDAAAEETRVSGPPPIDPDGWSEADWRRFLGDRGVKVTELLREAQRLAKEDGVRRPAALEDVAGPGTTYETKALLVGFVEDLALQRGGGS